MLYTYWTPWVPPPTSTVISC